MSLSIRTAFCTLALLALHSQLHARFGKKGFPMRFKDEAGRQVVLHEAPRRIVCLGSAAAEILLRIGASELIAGIDRHTAQDLPALAHLPGVGTLRS